MDTIIIVLVNNYKTSEYSSPQVTFADTDLGE